MVGQRELAVVGGVEESTIHSAGEIEGDVLIATAVVHALPILILQLEGLPAEVHFAETLPCADKVFVGVTAERYSGALSLWCRDEPQGQGIIARR